MPIMPRKKATVGDVKLGPEQIAYLQEKMAHVADRNPSAGIARTDYQKLFEYLAVQKITYLYDDELFDGLQHVDRKRTGKAEELLDAYLVLDQGDEVQLKLFQFKWKADYGGGISTKELYHFVTRMNAVFLHGDLQEDKTLEAFKEVREAFDEALTANKRARPRIQCYYIVNGQNVSSTDAAKVQEIRDYFAHDRQAYGFTFETYGGTDIYSLCAHGRVPILDETLEVNHEWGDESFLLHDIGVNPNGMPLKVLVGFVNVNQLIRLVDRYNNNELFEKNVRLFLGTGKDVNQRIIKTVTGNESVWFGCMNNGVSITAENVRVDRPAIKGKVRVRLTAMQIINGCQTVNALYHAKYSPDLKDRFQGNSNVMVRIYQIDPATKDFHDALIIATNSQNAIRPEDLLSNDAIQRTIQRVYQEYGIGYERKEGETPPGHGYQMTFSKEQAAMAYLGVFDGKCSKLRNSLSRREFFREGDEYYRVFNLRGPDGDTQPGPLPDGFEPVELANERALAILAARCIEEACRARIAGVPKQERGPLKKGAYYLARVVFIQHESEIRDLVASQKGEDRKPAVAKKVIAAMAAVGDKGFDAARKVFESTLKEYLGQQGGNEDAALKNTAFAELVDERSVKQ
jgi:hypothetical protein